MFKTKPEPVEHVGTTFRERHSLRKTPAMFAPSSYPASLNILFLRVEFQEDLNPTNAGTTGSGLWTDPAYAHNGNPDYWVENARTNFINYWTEVSYGKLVISIVMSTHIYKLPHTTSWYGNETTAALENLIFDSITTALSDTDPLTRPVFSEYDAVLIVHAGAGEESDLYSNSSNDIWSLYYSSTCISPDASGVGCLTATLKNGRPLSEAIIMPQTDSQDEYTVDPFGVYVHEFGHWLGLPDLYCTARICEPDGAGRWSLMGDGIYNADPASQADQSKVCTCVMEETDPICRTEKILTGKTQCIFGSSPAHLDAWSKVFLGWITPATTAPPTDRGNNVFNPVELSPDVVKVQASSATPSQYFLIENRQRTGFDKGLTGHGLLIWLIDETIVENNLPTNTINNGKYRPGVKVIEADNDWNLLAYGCGAPDDCGSAGDPFPGSTNNTAFTPHSVPASLPYTASAWVNIKNISETGSQPDTTTISADIGFSPFAPKTPGMYTNVVTWPANAETDIAAYQVYKNGTLLAATGTTSFADATAQMGDIYQVTAVDTIGNESDFSGQVIANLERVSGESNGNPQCFIATAAYGSSLDPHVKALRDFRDRFLLTNAAGRAFVRIYYRLSPPIADCIGRYDSLRMLTRSALTPVIYAIEYHDAFMSLLLGTGIVMMVARRKIRVQ